MKPMIPQSSLESSRKVELEVRKEENTEMVAGNVDKQGNFRFDERLGRLVSLDPSTPTSLSELNNETTKNEVEQYIEELLEVPKIHLETPKERVSRYLSRCGITSRRNAKKLIEEGVVKVNNVKIVADLNIDPLVDEITLYTSEGHNYPIKTSTKLYIFYKPRQIVCTKDDPLKRVTIYDYIRDHNLLKEEHFHTVGRLDYTSDGLLLLTNDGDLKRALELPKNEIQRDYRVRVYGRFNDDKLVKIRNGAVIAGEQYGPFWCNVDRYQTRNTWVNISMTQGKNREIRKIMQKNSLRVNRLKRVSYGPYTLSDVSRRFNLDETWGTEGVRDYARNPKNFVFRVEK